MLLVVPDRTRPLALGAVLDAVGNALLAAGIDPGQVTIAIASGSHASTEADAAPERLGTWARGVRILAHRPEDATASVGRTPAGTDVRVHPALLAPGKVLALGGIAFHYFAGFGGGPKLLFPGLGARASIADNHRRSLGSWPPGGLASGIEPGRLEGNPLAEDLAAVALLLPAATHLSLWEGETQTAVWRERSGFVAACERYARGRTVGVARAFDLVVASAGGHPRDLDVVQAHKALFHAALYARDGATLVLFAECVEGIGSRPLRGWLSVTDRGELEARARAAYDLNAQTAISLAAIAARCRVVWVGSGAPPELDALGIVRATDPLAALRAALERSTGPAALLPVATAVVPARA